MRRRYSRQTLLGASIIAGVAASICATLSLALLFFHNRGTVTIANVQDWRPLSLVWAVSALAIGWLLLLQSQKATPSDSTEPPPQSTRPNRRVLWTASLIVAVALSFPGVTRVIARASERQWPSSISSNAITMIVNLEMCCADCARGVDVTLRRQRGVEKADISVENDEIEIWFDPGKTSESAIIANLESHRFKVEKQ